MEGLSTLLYYLGIVVSIIFSAMIATKEIVSAIDRQTAILKKHYQGIWDDKKKEE